MTTDSVEISEKAAEIGFPATVWPKRLSSDSEELRRTKLVVGSAQAGVAIMVAAGVIASIVVDRESSSPAQIGTLILLAIVYALWSLHGMRRPVQQLLNERAAPAQPPRFTARTAWYFVVQVALAAAVFTLSSRSRGGALAWLVLLPPVAHSVILLPRLGIAAVVLTILAVLAANVGLHQGWPAAMNAMVAFAFALLFTLVFTLLAVSAERSRRKAQTLADELAEANDKLRQYAMEAEDLAAARERNRLAREIHDSLGHYLTVVNVQIEAARALQSTDAMRSRDALHKAQALTREGLQEIRRSVAALRAPPLDNKSLTAAIEQLVKQSRVAGVQVEMKVLGSPHELAPAAELTLYRAAQEGLTNVHKHAPTARATLMLDFTRHGMVCLSISDDGKGAPSAEETRGFGLLGLHERAHLLGGSLRTRTAPGAGFTLELTLPV